MRRVFLSFVTSMGLRSLIREIVNGKKTNGTLEIIWKLIWRHFVVAKKLKRFCSYLYSNTLFSLCLINFLKLKFNKWLSVC